MLFDFRAFAKHLFFFLPGSFPLSTFASQFLQSSLLHGSCINSRHLIFLDFLRFCVTIYSHVFLRTFGIIPRHSIILDSSLFQEIRTSQAFLYLSTLGCLAQGQRPEQRDVWCLFCRLLCSSFSLGRKSSVVI